MGPKIRSFSVPRGDAQQTAQHEIAYTQRKCLKDQFLRRKAVSCCGTYEVQSHLDRDDSRNDPPWCLELGRTRTNFASENRIDKKVAEIWWNECESRLWIDGKTQRHIGKWRPCVVAWWRKWQNNLPRSKTDESRDEPLPKADPSKVALPIDFKPWLDARYPELSQAAESWKTWANVPKEIQHDWYGETKPPFIDLGEQS